MYKEHYKKIIDTALSENRKKGGDIYYESHHIVPDFMFKNRKRKGPRGHLDGDPDSPQNKVLLTFQEHLMCHYYLYEILKGTHYDYSAGSALQFFFVKSTGSHKRQRELSEVDQAFLNDMAHLRQIGINSISNARKGMMPAVDAKTKQSVGSVSIDHPKIKSGEWQHHSKGKPSSVKPENMKSQKGTNNNNYKEMTDDRRNRLFVCVTQSLEDNYLSKKKLNLNIKKEFTEFNKISLVWVTNNFESIKNLVLETNQCFGTNIQYEPYYRSDTQKRLLSKAASEFKWYSNGNRFKQVRKCEIESFLKYNPDYKPGRWKN